MLSPGDVHSIKVEGKPHLGKCFNCYFDHGEADMVHKVTKVMVCEDMVVRHLKMVFCKDCIMRMAALTGPPYPDVE